MPQNLIKDIESGVKLLLKQGLPTVSVESIGTKDIDEDGQLAFKPPCVRTLYAGARYLKMLDNLALTYEALHLIDIYVCDSNLASDEAQREDSKRLLDQVLPLVVGARISLSDSKQYSDPVVITEIRPYLQDIVGMTYVASLQVPCIAQYSGVNNPTLSGAQD